MTLVCEVVQFESHPSCDGGIPLGLGDQVAKQSAGAEEAQADVGGLCEVSQSWRVGEVSGPWPSVDQRHHNLDDTYVFRRDVFDPSLNIAIKNDILPLRSLTGRYVSILWCRARHHHLLYEHWVASQTSQYTHALNLPNK